MLRIRFFVACLLLLSYPWQAMAAVAMPPCGGLHGHMQGVAAAGVHHHANPAPPAGHHHVAADHADSAAGPHAHPGASADSKCGTCAGCCTVAAVGHTAHVPAFQLPSIAAVPASTAAVRMRTTPPPDKPPRA